jgi:hypothetical protein
VRLVRVSRIVRHHTEFVSNSLEQSSSRASDVVVKDLTYNMFVGTPEILHLNDSLLPLTRIGDALAVQVVAC